MALHAPMAERILGSRTLAALTSPHGVDRYLEHDQPDVGRTEVRARVVDITRETSRASTRSRRSRCSRPAPGAVTAPASTSRSASRSTAPAVRPAASRSPRPSPARASSSRITVRAHTRPSPASSGSASSWCARRSPARSLHLSQAEGEFTLTESPATPTNNHLLMISGGSGITPVMSQIRTLLRDGYDGRANRKVTFLHYARSAEDQIFAEELRPTSPCEDNHIDVHLRYGDELFSAESLARLVPDFRDTDTWACGPAPMMSLSHEAYGGSPRLRVEFFKLATATAVDGGSAEGDVAFTAPGKSAANTGASLLEQAEALGLTPEYGCRMGICFSCVSPQDRGHRPQRPHRRGVLPARRGHPHLRQRPGRRLLRRPLILASTTERTMSNTMTTTTSKPRPPRRDDKLTPEQLEAFGNEIDAIRQRLIADLGEEDADYIRGIVKKQRQFEVAGRALFYLPPAWPLAVAALSVSKILDNMEIGHNVMHGQYDWMGDPGLNSRMYEWDNVCPSDQWKYSPQLHPPHLHQHPRQGPRHRLRHPADGRGPEVAPLLPGQPGLRVPADGVLRVGRGAARPRGREHRQRASGASRTTSRSTRA